MDGTFTSQLLAGHFQNESFKFRARQILADALQPVHEVLTHAILSALRTLEIESKGAEDRLPIGCSHRLS